MPSFLNSYYIIAQRLVVQPRPGPRFVIAQVPKQHGNLCTPRGQASPSYFRTQPVPAPPSGAGGQVPCEAGGFGHPCDADTILTGNLKSQFSVFSLSLVDPSTTSCSK